MSNRTYVCLKCKTSRRAVAAYGKPHGLRCVKCSAGLAELPWERRIPAKDDDEGWQNLRIYLVSQTERLVPPEKPKREKKPKGLTSLFQLPARKRKGKEHLT
jgi:hypothetical protein